MKVNRSAGDSCHKCFQDPMACSANKKGDIGRSNPTVVGARPGAGHLARGGADL